MLRTQMGVVFYKGGCGYTRVVSETPTLLLERDFQSHGEPSWVYAKDALLCIFNLKMHFCASLRFLALCPRRAALYGGLGTW